MYSKTTNSIGGVSALGLVILLSGCVGPISTAGLPQNPEAVSGRSEPEKPTLNADHPSPSIPNSPASQPTRSLESVPNKDSETESTLSSLPKQETALSVVMTPAPPPSDVSNATTEDIHLSGGINLNTPTLMLQASTEQIGVGEQVVFTIKTEQVKDLFSAPFYLRYDPQVLEFIGLTEGDFLKQDNNPTAFVYAVEPEIGQVIVGLSRLGEVTGMSGSGTLALATFKAKNPGKANVSFQNADFRNARFEPVSVLAQMPEIQIR